MLKYKFLISADLRAYSFHLLCNFYFSWPSLYQFDMTVSQITSDIGHFGMVLVIPPPAPHCPSLMFFVFLLLFLFSIILLYTWLTWSDFTLVCTSIWPNQDLNPAILKYPDPLFKTHNIVSLQLRHYFKQNVQARKNTDIFYKQKKCEEILQCKYSSLFL